jgi:hypothetical protein
MNVNCSHCGTDVYVEDYDPASDSAWCHGPGHPGPRLIEPKKEAAAAKAKASALNPLGYGIAYELGLYDDLPQLLNTGEWADTPTVEYRYGISHPEQYAEMLKRWGHVKQGPRKYSVTSFIGSTLGQLSRSTNVTYRAGPGTGFFAYNTQVGYWTLEPVPAQTTTTSWASCATSAGIDPDDWPLC